MNHANPIFGLRRIGWAAMALLSGVGAPSLLAQAAASSTPPSAVAGMSQDVQELQRTVSQLSLRIDTLEAENERLKKQIPSTQDLKTMIENAVAESRAASAKDLSQSVAELRKELSVDETQHLDALTKEFNAQLKKLADAIADKPVAAAPVIKRTPLPPDTQVKIIKVQRGDNLGKIAQANKVSTSDIINANPQISDFNKLREGQELAIPVKDGATLTPVTPSSMGK